MTDKIVWAFEDFLEPTIRDRLIREGRVKRLFRNREHARRIWDNWDGISRNVPHGDDALFYLKMIGDGTYCAAY